MIPFIVLSIIIVLLLSFPFIKYKLMIMGLKGS
jgi:hypothetical protein